VSHVGGGFRLASPVPEIDKNCLGGVLAVVLGSLGLLERRQLKAVSGKPDAGRVVSIKRGMRCHIATAAL
jgi:hypothetical protein